jgi:hypothetical protein
MKNRKISSLILSVALSFIIAVGYPHKTNAQAGANDEATAIKKITKVMTDSLGYLGLTSNQKTQVSGFNKTAATSLRDLGKKAKTDTSLHGRVLIGHVLDIMKQRNDELKKILTPDQAKLFQQHQAQQLADLQTKMMTTQLDLTEKQIPQVYDINLKSTQAILANMPNVRDGNEFKKIKAGNDLKVALKDKDKEMKKILSPDQYTKYEKNKTEMQAAIKERMKKKKEEE